MKIYKWSIANSQDSVDSMAHNRGQWKTEINYLIPMWETGKDLWKPEFFSYSNWNKYKKVTVNFAVRFLNIIRESFRVKEKTRKNIINF